MAFAVQGHDHFLRCRLAVSCLLLPAAGRRPARWSSLSCSRLAASCRSSLAISCSSFFVDGVGCRAIQASRLFTSAFAAWDSRHTVGRGQAAPVAGPLPQQQMGKIRFPVRHLRPRPPRGWKSPRADSSRRPRDRERFPPTRSRCRTPGGCADRDCRSRRETPGCPRSRSWRG